MPTNTAEMGTNLAGPPEGKQGHMWFTCSTSGSVPESGKHDLLRYSHAPHIYS